ncbi:MAG: anhydro-N-acetylmuramic acid kinase [Thiohalomonadaceae bacterium]
MSSELYIGLMSGTSLDGIDALLVDFQDSPPHIITSHHYPYPPALRKELLYFSHASKVELHDLLQMDVRLGKLYAQAVQELLVLSGLAANKITAIGSHGQTLRHHPSGPYPYSLQLGDANLVVEHTDITTVADFRRRDIAAGGQGAPLVPAFHAALFQSPEHNRVIINLGGMANITILPTDTDKGVIGYDTGPGNVLLDGWIALQHDANYDANGAWAASGHVLPDLLNKLLADPYFSQPPPKSTGREYFHLRWLQSYLNGSEAPQDVQATLVELTACSAARAIMQSAADTAEVFACGGGVKNTTLMRQLAELLAPIPVHSTAILGVEPQAVEAMAFAWLARQTMRSQAGNLPTVTGARHAVILGSIFPGRFSAVQ